MKARLWLLLAASLLILLAAGCGDDEPVCVGSDVSIDKFLADSNLTAEIAEDSIRFIVLDPGVGPAPTARDTVEFLYVGKTTDNDVFDESGSTPLTNIVAGLIPGFQIGLEQIGEGGRVKMLIPSDEGYGNQQAGRICPNTDLIFDVTLVNVRFFKP